MKCHYECEASFVPFTDTTGKGLSNDTRRTNIYVTLAIQAHLGFISSLVASHPMVITRAQERNIWRSSWRNWRPSFPTRLWV